MMGLTLVIVANTLFGATVDDEVEEIGSALTAVFEMFGFALMPFSELFDRVPIPTTIRLRRARARLDATIYRIIAERRKSGRDHGDLLSMLLLAQDTGDEGDGGSMTDVQLRDEATTLFVAGHETTSNALTWTWYALSQNPDAESRDARRARLGARRPRGRPLPISLAFRTRARYWPSRCGSTRRCGAWDAARSPRIPLRDMTSHGARSSSLVRSSRSATSGSFRIRRVFDRSAGSKISPSARASRTSRSAAARVSAFGEQFAWMEGVLLLATLGQRWRLTLMPGHKVEFNPLITLRPKHGMRMTLRSRT